MFYHYFAEKDIKAQKFKFTKFTCLETNGCESRVQAF